jgi:hypothetical protein
MSTPLPSDVAIARANHRVAVQRQAELQTALQEADVQVVNTLQTLLEALDSAVSAPSPGVPTDPQEV